MKFKTLVIVIAVLLFIQFCLGMINNLFVNIPNPSLNSLPYLVYVHMILGNILLIGGLVIVYYSLRQSTSIFSRLSILAIIFTALAIFSGIYFILNGLDDSFSMVMAVSFISVYSIYFYEFYRIGKMK